MILSNQWRQRKLAESWDLGIQHREFLVAQYMKKERLRERPFLKDIIDDLIEVIQQARLREGVLRLDTYGQSEVIDGRIEVTINTRIADMPKVKDAAGVAYVTKWHESLHIAEHLDPSHSEVGDHQMMLPGFAVEVPRLIVSRGTGGADPHAAAREFIAENAGLAAAIAGDDLKRSGSFHAFWRLAGAGDDLGARGWRLLYATAADIGVNPSAFVRYGEQRGLFRIEERGGKRHIIAAPRFDWR